MTPYTEPAQPDRANLDVVEGGDSWVVVADGVTPKPGRSGCKHGTQWYTTALVSALAARLRAAPDSGLPDLARAAITEVADSHRDSCDLTHPQHPSAMLAVLREHDADLDYLVIGDVLVLIEADDAVRTITDSRPDALPHFAPAFVQSRRNAPGGFVVAAADPDVVDLAVYGRVPRAMVARAAVTSDGGARLSDRFGQLDHAQLLDLIEFAGPARVVQRIRDAERDETAAELARRRGKQRDDATVVMVELLDLYTADTEHLLDRAAGLIRRLREAMDLEVWCGDGRPNWCESITRWPIAASPRRRGPVSTDAYLLAVLVRGVCAGTLGRPALTVPAWTSLAGVPTTWSSATARI
ncbi:LigA protein [Kutzneria sp. 744]|nr:LigA protein [Kutzneria sp. 744]